MTRKEFVRLNMIGGLGLLCYNFMPQNNRFTVEELTGKSRNNIIGKDFKLQKEAYEAFIEMKEKAKEAGINIKVISSFRDYDHQNRIWTRKYNNYINQGLKPLEAIYKIVEYSTIPGTSRHHWGTDIDIVDGNKPLPKDPLLAKHFQNKGPFCELKEWMQKNAHQYGFQLVYTNKPDRKGFKYEPWHFSYAPLSVPMLKEFCKLDLVTILQKNNLAGSKHFTSEFIQSYITNNILDVNPVLVKT